MLTQTGIGVGSVTFPRTEPMRGQYVFLMSKSRNLYIFLLTIIIWNKSASHFLPMVRLIS